jgi:hypothetical protein
LQPTTAKENAISSTRKSAKYAHDDRRVKPENKFDFETTTLLKFLIALYKISV